MISANETIYTLQDSETKEQVEETESIENDIVFEPNSTSQQECLDYNK